MRLEMGKIYNMDCLEGMRIMREQGIEVDAVITDPPYGTVKGAALDGWGEGKTEWDIAIEPREILEAVDGVLRHRGNMILFSQEPYTSRLRVEKHESIKFSMGAVWVKDHFANALISKKSLVHMYEDISIYNKIYDSGKTNKMREYSKQVKEYIGKSLSKINEEIGHRGIEHFFYHDSLQFSQPTEENYKELEEKYNLKEMEGYKTYKELEEGFKVTERVFNLPEGAKYKGNVFVYKKDYEGLHPTQKPLELMIDIIETYTNPGDKVLDFTMGSGTTAVACILTGREFIGFELDQEIYKKAVERVEKERHEERMRLYWSTGK